MENQTRDRIAQDVTLIPNYSSVILHDSNALEQYTAPKQWRKIDAHWAYVAFAKTTY